MSGEGRYIEAVLTVLEIGADGHYSDDQLDVELKRRGVDLEGVHIRGAKGLFEAGGDGRRRLSYAGLSLLLRSSTVAGVSTAAF